MFYAKKTFNIKSFLNKFQKQFYVSKNNKSVESRIGIKALLDEKKSKKKEIKKMQKKYNFSKPLVSQIDIFKPLSIPDLCVKLGIPPLDLVKNFPNLNPKGILTIQEIEDLCLDLDVIAITQTLKDINIYPFKDREENDAPQRPPIVTIMGHVDHGKTTLLDKLRNSNVAEHEFGGITQHIGAFEVQVPTYKQLITFIDTPGHAAFKKMRKAGAQTTDIVVLVVAADDGIMPQTIEAIEQAKEAGVKIIVAINKIDKIKFQNTVLNIEKELQTKDIVTENMGGDVPVVQVSALKGINIEKLLEEIILQGELLELKAKQNCRAEAVVIESSLNQGTGKTVSCVIKRGILKVGMWVICGTNYGKIRSIHDSFQNSIKEALPSKPVQISGLNGIPNSSEYILQVDSEEEAKKILEYRLKKKEIEDAEKSVNLDTNTPTIEIPILSVLLKADVQGTLDAIQNMFSKISTKEVKVDIIKQDVGKLTEGDIEFAKTTKSVVITMNSPCNHYILQEAKRKNVKISQFKIIYELVDHVLTELSKLLPVEYTETQIGEAEVLSVFEITNSQKEKIKVAGCIVNKGKISKSATFFNVIRWDTPLYKELKLNSLKQYKNEVESISERQEFGIILEDYDDVKVGDIISAITKQKIEKRITLGEYSRY